MKVNFANFAKDENFNRTSDMAFGFENKARIHFKRNFLRSVTFAFRYDAIDLKPFETTIKERLFCFFPRFTQGKDLSYTINFNANQTPIVRSESGNGYVLISANGLSNIHLNNASLVLTFLGNNYSRFEDILPIIEVIYSLLAEIGVKELRACSERKLNIANFQSQAPDVTTILKDLISPSFINDACAFPNIGNLSQALYSFVLRDQDYNLNLNYGIPQFDNSKRPLAGSVVIDIDLGSTKTISINQMVDYCKALNDEVFNVFFGITSDNLKQNLLGYE